MDEKQSSPLDSYRSRVIVSSLKTPKKVIRNLVPLGVLVRFLIFLLLFVVVGNYVVHQSLQQLFLLYGAIVSLILSNKTRNTHRYIYKTLYLLLIKDRNTFYSEDIENREVVRYVSEE